MLRLLARGLTLPFMLMLAYCISLLLLYETSGKRIECFETTDCLHLPLSCTRGVNLYIVYGLWGYVQLIRVGFLPLLTLEQGMKIIRGVYFTSVWLCNMVVFRHNPCAVCSRSSLDAKLRFPRHFITEPATGTGNPIFFSYCLEENGTMHLFSFGTVPKCRRFNGTALSVVNLREYSPGS